MTSLSSVDVSACSRSTGGAKTALVKASVERFRGGGAAQRVWPALTAADFVLDDHHAERVWPFLEDADCEGVYGYGHWDRAQFAAMVNEYLRSSPDADDECGEASAADVSHVWAVVVDPDLRRLMWSGVTVDTPSAFAVTVIARAGLSGESLTVGARGVAPAAGGAGSAGRSRLSMLMDCPLCGRAPVDPTRVDGELVCRTCAGACTICGSACVPGDRACGECERHLAVSCEAVPA